MSGEIRSPSEDEIRKQRYDARSGDAIEIVEDAEFNERLEHLRTLSNALNKTLQKKLEEADLPYWSWNKSTRDKQPQGDKQVQYPKVLRLAVLLRPEFYKSVDEDKTGGKRYTTADDQLTVFIHVRKDNSIQAIRYYNGSGAMTIVGFGKQMIGVYDDEDEADLEDQSRGFREKIKGYIQQGNMEALADHMINGINPAGDDETSRLLREGGVDFHKKAYTIASIEEAKDYFESRYAFLWEAPGVMRNLVKIILTAILESKIKKKGKENSLESVKEELSKLGQEVLNIKFKEVLGEHRELILGSYIEDGENYIKQTIQQLIRVYKPRLLGWQK